MLLYFTNLFCASVLIHIISTRCFLISKDFKPSREARVYSHVL